MWAIQKYFRDRKKLLLTSAGDCSLLFVCSEEGDCSFKPRGDADATDGNFLCSDAKS